MVQLDRANDPRHRRPAPEAAGQRHDGRQRGELHFPGQIRFDAAGLKATTCACDTSSLTPWQTCQADPQNRDLTLTARDDGGFDLMAGTMPEGQLWGYRAANGDDTTPDPLVDSYKPAPDARGAPAGRPFFMTAGGRETPFVAVRRQALQCAWRGAARPGTMRARCDAEGGARRRRRGARGPGPRQTARA